MSNLAYLADLADVDDLAVRTGRPVGDRSLLSALSRASSRFRGAVRHPVSVIYGDTIVVDGDGSSTLLLPAVPVLAVHDVTVGGVSVTDWELSADGRLRRYSGWPDRFGSITVTYDHGFDPVPDDVTDAVLEMAAATLNVEPGVSSMSVGGESISFVQAGITQSWSAAVDRYRIGRDRP